MPASFPPLSPPRRTPWADAHAHATYRLRPALLAHTPSPIYAMAETSSGRLLLGLRQGQMRVVVDGGQTAAAPPSPA
jgi:hypothetical protein